jgi:hypothetical protein
MTTDIWDVLMDKVRAGEMEMEEAHQRHGYYGFATHCPAIDDPAEYVLTCPAECLPPVIFVPDYDRDEVYNYYALYTEKVRNRELGPYEAAQEYYDAVSNS